MTNVSNLWRNSISVGRASLSVGRLYIHLLSVEQYIIAIAKWELNVEHPTTYTATQYLIGLTGGTTSRPLTTFLQIRPLPIFVHLRTGSDFKNEGHITKPSSTAEHWLRLLQLSGH